MTRFTFAISGLSQGLTLRTAGRCRHARDRRDVAVEDRVVPLDRRAGQVADELDGSQRLLREARDRELPAADGADGRVGAGPRAAS